MHVFSRLFQHFRGMLCQGAKCGSARLAGTARSSPSARPSEPVGSLRPRTGRRCSSVHPGTIATGKDPVGAGQAERAGSGEPLRTRPGQLWAADGRTAAGVRSQRCGCAVDHGGRAPLWQPCRRRRGNLGKPARAWIHRHETSGPARRAKRYPCRAHSLAGCSHPFSGAPAVAADVPAFRHEPAGRPGCGRTGLAGGAVPRSGAGARHMDRAL